MTGAILDTLPDNVEAALVHDLTMDEFESADDPLLVLVAVGALADDTQVAELSALLYKFHAEGEGALVAAESGSRAVPLDAVGESLWLWLVLPVRRSVVAVLNLLWWPGTLSESGAEPL